MNVPNLLEKVLRGERLSSSEAYSLAKAMAENAVSDVEKAAALVALRCGHEAPEEIEGFVRALLDLAVKVGPFPEAIDTAGTGGDKANVFNVSTATAIALGAMGYRVVKHVNRSVPRAGGSADGMEA